MENEKTPGELIAEIDKEIIENEEKISDLNLTIHILKQRKQSLLNFLNTEDDEKTN